jgi:hypothetical protein
VENDRLLVKPLPNATSRPATERIERRVDIQLRQSRQELERVASELKDSIYRESNVAALEQEDERREREATAEPASDTRAETLRQALGGPPMSLANFIAVIQGLDVRGQKEYGPVYRVFQSDPSPLPKTHKSLPPPAARNP